jgi:acyl carrier protein
MQIEITREKILKMLYESINELNEQLGKDNQLAQSSQTKLLAPGTSLDSLGFVNLVALIEEKCQENFNLNLILSNSIGMPGDGDPFETIGTLANYIEQILIQRQESLR